MGNLSYKMFGSHSEDCGSPEVKRLYIREVRDIPSGHRQVFVPWGYTCLCCGKIKIEKEWDMKNTERYEEVKRRRPKEQSSKDRVIV